MSGPLTLILKAQPKTDGLDAAFTTVNRKSRDEPGTLTHRMFRQADGNVAFYDDYASSDAFLAHFGAAKESGALDTLMAACDITDVLCLGDPTPEAKAVLDQLGATYASHVVGFSKLGLAATT